MILNTSNKSGKIIIHHCHTFGVVLGIRHFIINALFQLIKCVDSLLHDKHSFFHPTHNINWGPLGINVYMAKKVVYENKH